MNMRPVSRKRTFIEAGLLALCLTVAVLIPGFRSNTQALVDAETFCNAVGLNDTEEVIEEYRSRNQVHFIIDHGLYEARFSGWFFRGKVCRFRVEDGKVVSKAVERYYFLE